jgi:hypothetical protein
LENQFAERWLMSVEVQPGLDGDLSQPGWRRFDAPLKLGFVYLVDADLQWFFGMRIYVRSRSRSRISGHFFKRRRQVGRQV